METITIYITYNEVIESHSELIASKSLVHLRWHFLKKNANSHFEETLPFCACLQEIKLNEEFKTLLCSVSSKVYCQMNFKFHLQSQRQTPGQSLRHYACFCSLVASFLCRESSWGLLSSKHPNAKIVCPSFSKLQ